MNDRRNITITIPAIARVEGEGALTIRLRNGKLDGLDLRIFEPPRYFEKLLEGREYHEVPDIVARICGICPVAYQMSAVQALEMAFGMEQSAWVRDMRRLFYCGEWIQSHALHIHLLAAPDFLGFSNVADMAKKYAGEVRRGLRLQAAGNAVIRLLGARSVHPVGARVGGFSRIPPARDIVTLLEQLYAALTDAKSLIQWTASIDLPAEEQDFCSVSLRHEHEYPMAQGRLVSSDGLDIGIGEYGQHFHEFQVPHSTALHAHLHDHPYLTGPLARLNLNHDRLPDATRQLLDATGIALPGRNMFHSIIARAVEIHFALCEAIRLLEAFEQPDGPAAEATPRQGIGYGCTEAPRGILWHRYETDGDGRILAARIVPPTSQNQARIEQDLKSSLQAFGPGQPETDLKLHAEKVIRNYDPCISCATHFLRLEVERSAEDAVPEQATGSDDRPADVRVRVIGLGSGLGLDEAGPALVEALAGNGFCRRFPEGMVDLQTCYTPAALAQLLDGAGACIIFDALPDANVPGSVVPVSLRALESATTTYDSHGFGLHQALALIESLAARPIRVSVFGISTGPVTAPYPDRGCRKLVEAALPAATAAIEREIRRIQAQA